MKPALVTVVAALALAAQGLAGAEPGQSLYEARRGIIHGTSKGIPIFETSPKAAAAAAAAASAAGKTTAEAAADRFAPTGTALPAAKRLEAADLGTPLPTGTPAGKTK